MKVFPHDLSLLVYADIHHGDRANGRRQQDMVDAEEFITNLAIERGVDWVVFAGDAFKHRNPHDEHKTLWLKVRFERSLKFDEAGIRQLDVVGNHCRYYKSDNSGHVFSALGTINDAMDSRLHWISSVQETLAPDGAVVFYTLPAQTEYAPERWDFDTGTMDGTDPIRICVFHGMVESCALNASGTVKASDGIPMKILDRPEFDFVVGGDIHIPQILDFKNTLGGYVGSTVQLDEHDLGEKRGCMIVNFKKGESQPNIEFIPVPHAELTKLVWDTAEPFPDLEPYRGTLCSFHVVDSACLPLSEIEARAAELRSVARHVNVSRSGGRVQYIVPDVGEERVGATPLEDFEVYIPRVDDIQPEQRGRMLNILATEVLNSA